MPRVAKAKAETVETTNEFEVKDHMKTNGSIMVGTQFIPIVDGKVKYYNISRRFFKKRY